MPQSYFLKLAALCLLGLSIGCRPSSNSPGGGENADSGKLKVVCTTAMVGDVVRGVGGEHVDVTVMLGPGVDPHLHKTSRDDTALLMNADVVFYSGLMLEGKMTDTLAQVGKSIPVHALTERMTPEQLISPEGQHAHPDPHVWFDVTLWASTSEVAADVLAKRLPEHAEEFHAAATAYQERLKPVADYASERLATIPEEQRILITSHDAFGYLGRAYGIEVLGVQGISTDSEAGLRRVNELVDLLVEKKVPAVFIESSVSEKSIEALIEGAASRGATVKIGGMLFSDAAGPGGTYEGTYEGMVDHNVTIITHALGGEAPERGLNGKLALESE
ncbi:metal ABC transporter solute-binding protein, Zn/Mn family [Aporhodopirellula aestuarii]|uniref:Zinc ABC transporter substrate-binding protein n=1 Tax=Aporhodopirellula aestuarii TaxID=2950107 RepID=A0ABT0TWR1_9BACT|nr:zinc ABC transporter substrate-binding protein [Aporhodopirellula aestuarii]MCM2369063.1 zinc ABC transporter substrate-binding protein [Aporhodopirellula aestuarii]